MSQPFLSWIEVDLDAIAFNVRNLKQFLAPHVRLGIVTKGNAYGHGAPQVTRVALESGADWAIVNRSNEGVQLRQGGITAPVLILGYTLPEEADRLVRWELRPTVSNLLQAEALSGAAVRQGVVANIHVKVDTGLGRQGLLPEEMIEFFRDVSRLPHLKVEGMYSHFSVAEEGAEDSVGYTRCQFDTFIQVRDELAQAGFAVPISHICNTAAALNFPEMHLDMVRVGSLLGGIYPSVHVKREVALLPSLSLKSHVARVKVLPAGSAISYGRTYVTQAPTQIALVPVGYGDGYRRGLSNKGSVLIRGQRVPIVGRICMDQCMVDATHIPDIALHDEVVLIGCQNGECITGEEVGSLLGTNAYDITTSFTSRLPRVYVQNGQVVGVSDLVEE